jgi:hypothetical protein
MESINFIDKKISIIFDQLWFQEDINTLRQQILNKIKDHQVIEIIQGADRESCRFTWLDTEFNLHFDYYSQSCWFNTHDEITSSKIQSLFDLLAQN